MPLMEQKIEQVLRSPSPSECFTDKTVKVEYFIFANAATIAYAGNDEAMRQVAKLLQIDEKRFDDLVDRTLRGTENRGNPENQGNPYIVAYHSLEMGEPLVEKRIYVWAQARAAEKDPYRTRKLRKFWAEAMVNRYSGAPTERQWAEDPFISRLNLSDEAELHKDLITYANAVVEQRAKH